MNENENLLRYAERLRRSSHVKETTLHG